MNITNVVYLTTNALSKFLFGSFDGEGWLKGSLSMGEKGFRGY